VPPRPGKKVEPSETPTVGARRPDTPRDPRSSPQLAQKRATSRAPTAYAAPRAGGRRVDATARGLQAIAW